MDIDFDKSSLLWRENKKYKGNGKFVYICEHIKINGKRCRKTVYSQRTIYSYQNNDSNASYNNHPNKDIYCEDHIV